jgi:two-component system chemotaxis sensor kinase CheA
MSSPDPARGAEQFAATYREEASELLTDLESTLLDLEARPDDEELVARIFRALHTIKGSGAMFGFTDIASFTHHLENAFDEVRKGKVAVTSALVSLALEGKDQIRAMLSGDAESGRVDRDNLLAALRGVVAPKSAPLAAAAAPGAAERAPQRSYRVTFRPNPDLLQDGTNPLGIWAELMSLGQGEIVAAVDPIPCLEDLDPERCYVTWTAFLTTDRDDAALRDVFMFVEDRGELHVEMIDDGLRGAIDYMKLGEILVERGALNEEDLTAALASQPRLGTLLKEKGLVDEDTVRAALAEQQFVRRARASRAGAAAPEAHSVRVGADKLDLLVDLVGELVIAQARLSQVAARCEDAELHSIAEDVERLAAELRDNTLNLRMVPIGSTFSRFKRLVHDLAAELKKEIELSTDGAETELDKTVIERLGDPLVHIIRNCCDHGIEPPDTRAAAGKARAGKVRLAAYQSGSSVVIEIHDDGAGLDSEAIRRKAISRGLIEPEARLSEQELFQLIFLPGFSTAATVSAVSGRGVGMDVVKRSVDALRGAVDIESRRGAGTTIRIKLPLTLAIIDGLLVSVGAGRYVLPMSLVEECVEITRESVAEAHGAHLVPVRGELVPYLRLREWFGEGGARPPIEQVAIASAEGLRFGFAVDDVIGQHQTVIKTLGKMYCDTDGLSGATILGDGTVALIVDVAGVIRTVTAAAPREA